MVQVRDSNNNIAPKHALPNSVDVHDSLNDSDNTGFMVTLTLL